MGVGSRQEARTEVGGLDFQSDRAESWREDPGRGMSGAVSSCLGEDWCWGEDLGTVGLNCLRRLLHWLGC